MLLICVAITQLTTSGKGWLPLNLLNEDKICSSHSSSSLAHTVSVTGSNKLFAVLS